jgi:hypothetical protein
MRRYSVAGAMRGFVVAKGALAHAAASASATPSVPAAGSAVRSLAKAGFAVPVPERLAIGSADFTDKASTARHCLDRCACAQPFAPPRTGEGDEACAGIPSRRAAGPAPCA